MIWWTSERAPAPVCVCVCLREGEWVQWGYVACIFPLCVCVRVCVYVLNLSLLSSSDHFGQWWELADMLAVRRLACCGCEIFQSFFKVCTFVWVCFILLPGLQDFTTAPMYCSTTAFTFFQVLTANVNNQKLTLTTLRRHSHILFCKENIWVVDLPARLQVFLIQSPMKTNKYTLKFNVIPPKA